MDVHPDCRNMAATEPYLFLHPRFVMDSSLGGSISDKPNTMRELHAQAAGQILPGPPVVVFITVQRNFYRHRPGLKSFLFTILNQIRLSYLYALIPGSSEPFTLGWGTRTILPTVLSRSRIAISYASRT